jgi:hypothetical protein
MSPKFERSGPRNGPHEREAERRLPAIEHAIAHLEGERVESQLPPVVEPRHAGTIVIGNAHARLDGEILKGMNFTLIVLSSAV